MALIAHLGCIQYDTINVVGRNADLVLQSRIAKYRPTLLAELLYKERKLIDGYDKQAALYAVEDWPYFARRRELMAEYYNHRSPEAVKAGKKLLGIIQKHGPKSSLDFEDKTKTDWHWGETNLTRAALELRNRTGELGIHHKVNTRRIFDLNERLIPKKILKQPDPNRDLESYHDWHVLRRLGSMGLASSRAGEYWGMISELKSKERAVTLGRLADQGKVTMAAVEGLAEPLFMRTVDLPTLEKINGRAPKAQASFIAPLDNLIWIRKLIGELFGFKYVWEVYKPKNIREYGYYTMPVLYGDRFVARIDAKLDRKTNILTINGWWWEAGIKPDDEMLGALNKCMRGFLGYLGTNEVVLGERAKGKKGIRKIIKL